MGRELIDKRQASTIGAKEHFCECPFLSGCAATGSARLNLEARALAVVSGLKVERRGQEGASNTLSAADAGHRRHIIALGLIALGT